jgi:hypothetical protein
MATAPRPVSSDDPLQDLEAQMQAAHAKLAAAEARLNYQSDEAAPIFGGLSAFAGGLVQTVRAIRGIVQSAQAPITADDIKRLNAAASVDAARQLPAAIDRVARQRFWLYGLFTGLALFAALGAGAGLHWYWTPKLTCQAMQGGVVCFYWQVPATEPPPTSEAPAVVAPQPKGKR